jgi:hypothetical protein
MPITKLYIRKSYARVIVWQQGRATEYRHDISPNKKGEAPRRIGVTADVSLTADSPERQPAVRLERRMLYPLTIHNSNRSHLPPTEVATPQGSLEPAAPARTTGRPNTVQSEGETDANETAEIVTDGELEPNGDTNGEDTFEAPQANEYCTPSSTRLYECGCNESFNQMARAVKHVKSKYGAMLMFRCDKCEEAREGYRGARIHYEKCKYEVPLPRLIRPGAGLPAQPAFPCEQCEVIKATVRGLGQHVRHAHPNLANEKRIAGVRSDIERKTQRRQTAREQRIREGWTPGEPIWNPEATLQLEQLCNEYRGCGRINVLIAQRMPQYTNKQIKDRRRRLLGGSRYTGDVAPALEAVAADPPVGALDALVDQGPGQIPEAALEAVVLATFNNVIVISEDESDDQWGSDESDDRWGRGVNQSDDRWERRVRHLLQAPSLGNRVYSVSKPSTVQISKKVCIIHDHVYRFLHSFYNSVSKICLITKNVSLDFNN